MEKTEITEKNPNTAHKNTLTSIKTQLLIFGLFASVFFLQYRHGEAEKEKREKLSQASINLTQGKYPEATEVFLPLALKGNIEAQMQLGFLYLKGSGFQEDKIAAAKWFTLAANQDHAEALYQLAALYESIGREFQNARSGKCPSILQGNFQTSSVIAQSLGSIIGKMGSPSTDECVTKIMTQILALPDWKTLKPETLKTQEIISNPRVLSYLTKASDLKNTSATFRLAQIWRDGEYAQKPDVKKAYDLFLKAAQSGNNTAMLEVARMNRDGIGITKNDKVALTWFEKAAKAESVDAYLDLALMYHSGTGTTVDNARALAFAQKFLQAAKTNKTKAYLILGEIAEKGVTGTPNISASLSWYEKAIENGEVPDDIKLKLSQAYALGDGVEQSLVKAWSFFQKINEEPNFSDTMTKTEYQKIAVSLKEMSSRPPQMPTQEEIPAITTVQSYLRDKTNITDDDVQSQYILGYAYENGIGVETNIPEATLYYTKAANHDFIPAIKRLLKITEKKSDLDKKTMFPLLLKAANIGIPSAQKQVATLYLDGQGVDSNKWEALKWFLAAASSRDETIQIPREAIDKALKNTTELYTHIRVIPYYQNGKPEGFKFLSVKKDSFFDTYLKLKRGDLLKNINGMPLDIQNGTTLFEKLKNETRLEVAMTRRGQDIKNIYEITP